MSISKKGLCIFASLVIGISVFFPYLSASFLGSTMSKALIDATDGYIILAIAAVGLLASVFEKYILSLVAGAASLIAFFIENGSLSKGMAGMDSLSAELAKSMLQNGMGYYLLLIGSIALILFSILGAKDVKQDSDG